MDNNTVLVELPLPASTVIVDDVHKWPLRRVKRRYVQFAVAWNRKGILGASVNSGLTPGFGCGFAL